ncbi:hypothetical protein POM88_004569 [Heracleum sosnowskyi]|uniref:Uncharacterized protein n=1 Tax=Heracleum sosnowskyi TaxID=360622 RepID=A0AAD8JIM4_9APIA|nr:hypothetical protein POM88_004569 [Heracleum sosnowskyi]
MGEYRESLALIGRVMREDEYVVVIWVLREIEDNGLFWDEMSVIKLEACWTFEPMGFINKDQLVMWSATYGFLYNVKNECGGLKFTTVVQSSSDVKHSIRVGVVDRLSDFNELRMYMIKTVYLPKQEPRQPKMKEVASTSTSNRYDVLSDSDIWSAGC